VIKFLGEDGQATYRFGQHETKVLNLSSKISRKCYKHA